MAAVNQPHIYRPDELAPCSGVYHVTHASRQCPEQDQTFITGDRFPTCPTCGSAVGYVLVEAAPHIKEDPDLCGE
jgi:hypothetical protein